MDRLPRVAAHRVTHVVSLSAVTIIAVVVLAFASAPMGVYLLVIAILVGTFVALILFPRLGLGQQQLYGYLMAKLFWRFSPELSQVDTPKALTEADEPLEESRLGEYEANRGLFLGHYWRPSEQVGQKADIRIQLRDHPHPDGRPTPLEEGKVESVAYQLGPKFSEDAITKRNRAEAFALDVSAYGSVLCLAVVTFNDDMEPLYLSRYIDFPEDL